MNKCYKITAGVEFPEGIAPGAGSRSNKKILARNGKGKIILRGSALAGILRSAYADKLGKESWDEDVVKWFGQEAFSDIDNSSLVKTADTVIRCSAVNERTHNMVNRHTGAPAKGAIFSLEAVPPMACADLSILLNSGEEEKKACEKFILDIAAVLGADPFAGGSINRGIGRMTLAGDLFVQTFDLDTVEGVAAFMDTEYEARKNGVAPAGEKLDIPATEDLLTLSLVLGIPRGEDLLVGDGQETDYAFKPQSIDFVDGSRHWRIPGSSFRGIFRGWMTRLAVRGGAQVMDSAARWDEQYDDNAPMTYKPDLIGWGFVDEGKRARYHEAPDLLEDPILDLFGSMYKRGRIHFTDSFSRPVHEKQDIQDRMHVAVDRFSGGTNEGALFKNQVLAGKRLEFPVTISIKKPLKQEVGWLVKTLRALHLGILSIGASKSSGRLEIKSISAKGANAEVITEFMKEL